LPAATAAAAPTEVGTQGGVTSAGRKRWKSILHPRPGAFAASKLQLQGHADGSGSGGGGGSRAWGGYVFFEYGRSFEEAEWSCWQYEGHLASVHTERHSTLLFNQTLSRFAPHLLKDEVRLWIGLRTGESRIFESTWTDGTKLDYGAPWTEFAQGTCYALSCNAVAEQCSWDGRPCDEELDGFVCELPDVRQALQHRTHSEL
jgi:hypothetical protein